MFKMNVRICLNVRDECTFCYHKTPHAHSMMCYDGICPWDWEFLSCVREEDYMDREYIEEED